MTETKKLVENIKAIARAEAEKVVAESLDYFFKEGKKRKILPLIEKKPKRNPKKGGAK